MAGRKGHTCPYCGSPDAIPIVYGYPTMEASTEAEEGKIHLGGCCCWGDERDHKWYCRRCGTEYGGKGMDPYVPPHGTSP